MNTWTLAALLLLALSLGLSSAVDPRPPTGPAETRGISDNPEPYPTGIIEGPDPIPQSQDDGKEY